MLKNLKDYLSILELDETASKEDIQAAYRRMALKYHPDKNKNGGELFTKVTEAKNILLAWDGPLAWDDTEQNQVLTTLLSQLIDTMQSFVENAIKKQRCKKDKKQKHVDKTQPHIIRIDVEVTLDDVYLGRIKKLIIKIKGPESTTIQETLYISLFNFKPKYIFKGKGDFILDGDRGDVYVNVNIKEHPLVKRDTCICPFDLYIEFDMSLYDHYCRRYLALPFLNNELIEVMDIKPGTKCACIKGKGLPYMDAKTGQDTRGELYVYFNLILPEFQEVPDNVVKILQEYFAL